MQMAHEYRSTFVNPVLTSWFQITIINKFNIINILQRVRFESSVDKSFRYFTCGQQHQMFLKSHQWSSRIADSPWSFWHTRHDLHERGADVKDLNVKMFIYCLFVFHLPPNIFICIGAIILVLTVFKCIFFTYFSFYHHFCRWKNLSEYIVHLNFLLPISQSDWLVLKLTLLSEYIIFFKCQLENPYCVTLFISRNFKNLRDA